MGPAKLKAALLTELNQKRQISARNGARHSVVKAVPCHDVTRQTVPFHAVCQSRRVKNERLQNIRTGARHVGRA